MTLLVLHAGFHKTGTSAIQHFASRNRRRLREGGILYPRMGLMSIRPNSGHHALIHALAESEGQTPVRFARLQGLVRRWRRQAIATDCSVLVSSEAICRYMPTEPGQNAGEGPEFVTRMKSLLADFEVVPVVVIRRQDDFVRSLYQEHVMAGVGESARVSFPEFLDRSAVGKARFLERLRAFREHFGVVRVFVYEELAGEALPISFLRQLGATTLDGCVTPVVRRSLSVGETLVKKRLNKWIRGRSQNRLALMWLRSRAVQRIIESKLSAIDTLWPDHQERMAFINQFDDENAQIAAEFFDRDGMIFSPLTVDATWQAPCPADSVVDAVVAEAVRATRWRVQMLLGRQAVSELLRV